MKFFDLIDFNPAQLKHKASFYGFSHVYSTVDVDFSSGKPQTKGGSKLKIFVGETNSILKNLRKSDVFYSKSYEASLELFAKAKEQEKPFMINLSDIVAVPKPHLSMYRIERFVRVARHYDIGLITVSLAKDEFLVRSPAEAGSILKYCGLTPQQVAYSYSLIGDMVKDKIRLNR